MVDVSLTAVNTFLECEKRYDYRYRQRLEPLNKRPEPIVGQIAHYYLERYYSLLRDHVPAASVREADVCSETAWRQTVNKYEPELLSYRQAAWMMGDLDAAEAWDHALENTHRLIVNYHRYRGRADARRWEVLYVEQPVAVEVFNGIVSRGVVDLVVRDRFSGRIGLVEHKTTGTIPDDGVRLRDLQTPMYGRMLELQEGVRIDEVVWNYMRTKTPTRPKVNKDGSLSRAQIDTTRREYLTAIQAQGLKWRDYRDMLRKLGDKARRDFFPRISRVIVADVDELIDNYRRGVAQLNNRVEEWETFGSQPIRNLSRGCQFCEFSRLCDAALVSGDESDVIRTHYTRKGKR